MPKSTHVHKSQLLRGLVEPRRALDQHDIDLMRNRSRNAGRSYGGAPLHDNNRRGGRDGGRGGSINYSNPFAGHLDPNFAPQNPIAPPPHLAAQFPNWMPPPPPVHYAGPRQQPPMNGGSHGQNYGSGYGGHYQNYNQYGSQQGHNQNRGGNGYGYQDYGNGQSRRGDRQDGGGGHRGGRGGSRGNEPYGGGRR
jgi:5'-3' exoribonuclease 2